MNEHSKTSLQQLKINLSAEATSIMTYYKTRNTGTRNTRGTTEQRRNNGTPPEHGTPAERRNNGTPPKQSKHRGTAEHYDRALGE